MPKRAGNAKVTIQGISFDRIFGRLLSIRRSEKTVCSISVLSSVAGTVYERGVVRRDEVGSQFINYGINPNRIVEYIINPSNLFSHITREVLQLAVLRHCSVSTAVGDRESQPRVDERGLADIE
jgi:hypothetical protein